MYCPASTIGTIVVLLWYLSSFYHSKPLILLGFTCLLTSARENEDDRVLVMVNFTGDNLTYETSEAGISDKEKAELLISNYPDQSENIGSLRPYEAVVIRCK